METEAVDVAVAVARKLCSELIAAEPLGEITGLVSDCFSHLVSTPHLVVRINDQLYEAARERIERLAKQSGFEGRLVILAEPEIETGDCRIEWADGGVVLERAAIEAKINELVGRYMASRNQAEQGHEDLNHERHRRTGSASGSQRRRRAADRRRGLSTKTNRPRALPPTWRRCSTCRCRSRPCSAAPRWTSANC